MARTPDAALKKSLLRAAAHEFAKLGFGAKIEDISARAGYSKAAFYLHFESKEAAFCELATGIIEHLEVLIHDDDRYMRESRPLSARPAILGAVIVKHTRILEYLWENRMVARLVYEPVGTLGYSRLWEGMFERGRRRFERFVACGIRQKFFAEHLDPKLTSLLFVGAQERLTRHVLRSAKRPDIAALVQQSHRTLFEGMLPQRA